MGVHPQGHWTYDAHLGTYVPSVPRLARWHPRTHTAPIPEQFDPDGPVRPLILAWAGTTPWVGIPTVEPPDYPYAERGTQARTGQGWLLAFPRAHDAHHPGLGPVCPVDWR